MQLTPNKKK